MSFTNIESVNLGTPTSAIQIPALKYLSGGRVWYAATIPYRTLGKFIQTSAVKKKNQAIKKDIKNRFLDKKHKDDIVEYLRTEKEFTLPPITLVSYESLDFRPYEFKGQSINEEEILENGGSVVGVIVLPIDYEFECLDGNHRTAAIRDLANEEPHYIVGSSMLLNIVYENRPKKIRQDFVDVNRNAKQTTSSINTLFNTRDPISNLVVDLIEQTDYLNETTELLSTSVSKLSKDIYTINNIRNVVIEIAGFNSQGGQPKKLENDLSDLQKETQLRENAKLFFEVLKKNPNISACLEHREKTPDIRSNSVLTNGTGIIVASRIAGYIFTQFDNKSEQERELGKLLSLDWTRSNHIFEGRILIDKKIVNSREAIAKAVAVIKMHLGYQLEETDYKYMQ
ncbi:DNA sulfur modification protein DndB [Sporosarcina sp. G11-34]|uniref:DNA sulfur modification protein DndB n=1 Tax=Sporosarcina sp. G11-34 TaxID=2849605 RepID=UPI0022A9C243|nr:DNA sulfur modification protein DndB [Sporosarcina sp. G11-34]MCZ2260769.1 DNA sulfur modification protein DndB [Sporosarcina sp. G11-34]